MSFLGKNYLIANKAGVKLFDKVKDLPIVDPHNHANVAEIADNNNYDNPWHLFASTDHYVWEVLRKRAVPEKYITGNATPEEKWMKMAEVFPDIAGNPVYEWIHLDLRRYLGIDDILGPDTGKQIWDKASKVLAREDKKPQALLKEIGVEVMCSTDDPLDMLEDHKRIKEMTDEFTIRPTWRPDKAMNIFSKNWADYIDALETRFDTLINSVGELMQVLRISHDYFHECGCRASDHGVARPYSGIASEKDANDAFKTARSGVLLTAKQTDSFMSYLLGEMAELNAEKDWAFQLHCGPVRDVRKFLFDTIGPDAGGDISDHNIDIVTPLIPFLNRFDNRLKVVLYCLEPTHTSTLATISRAFGAKVNLGSAWWLCDTPIGMKRQLEYICSVDLFANFAGMVSDSRKLLSYGSRFEMFRRILCDVVGNMVERGQIPEKIAENLVTKMCYNNPKELFGI